MDKGNIINKSGSFRYICLFLMSFSAIFFQVSLIRSLSNIYYGTLTYFIISMALLGFGASGTVLFLLKKKLQDYSGNIILLLLLYLISIPFSLFFSNKIPLNLLYIFYDPRQILFLFTYSLLLFLPFFFCGMIIGLTLINEKNKEYFYGINLLGSGIGGITALIAMYYVDPLILVKLGFYPVAAAFLVSLVKFRISSKKYFLLFFLIPSGLFLIFSLPGNPDQYKDIYQYKLLEKQGDAGLLTSAFSPYGKVEAWSSSFNHSTLFAGLENIQAAPEQLSLFNDGNLIGSFFQIDSVSEAEILDNTIQSLPYRLLDKAQVLLIGDSGLTNLWLALRYGADSVTLLLPDKSIKRFLLENLAKWTERFQNNSQINIIAQDFRQFFVGNNNFYDIIHFASAESLSGSMSGLYSFQENYNLTVEAFRAAWFTLSERGFISVSRGNQIPSKDNLKILLTMYKAGMVPDMAEPEKYLFQLSSYLASISLFSKNEFDQKSIDKLMVESDELNLEIIHYPGEKINYEDLIDNWIFDVRPAEDNRPFFNSFFRWKSLRDFYNLFGTYWFRQSDLGYLILLITLVIILILAFILILLPFFLRKAPFKNPFLLYFPLIGFAFMFIEMVFIQKMSLFWGHSSFSISVTLSSLLVFSGIGSIMVRKIKGSIKLKLIIAISVISTITLLILIFSKQIIYIYCVLAGFSLVFTWLFMLMICGVTGFFMGWFFAPALAHLERVDKNALPLAWALNGFASVAASPLAVLLSISRGFFLPVACSIFLYVIAYFVFYHSISAMNR